MDTDVIAGLRQMQQAAEADLLAATADASLCVLAKSGRSFPAIKYHEGRAAVLSAVVQALTRAEDRPMDAVTRERGRVDRLAGLAEHNADWEAYVHGGLDTLDRNEALL